MAKFPRHPRYIPIIKWQDYEQKALAKVDAALLPRLHPCIEVRTTQQHTNLLANLKKVWPHDVLVDYANPEGVLTPVRQAELLDFLQHAANEKLPATPVLGPAHVAGMGPQFTTLAAQMPSVAVRLRLQSLLLPDDKLALTVGAFAALKAAGISSSLIVDLGESPKAWDQNAIAGFGNILRTLSAIGYQTIHLVSGAYPASLAAVNGYAKFDRLDWQFWQDTITAVPDLVVGYGDYGILAPGWTEKTLMLRSNRLAIRYTRDDNWLILRADGKTKTDSVAISVLLVNNYANDFKGAGYSHGDDLLSTRADPAVPLKKKKCGNCHITEGWSHHIAYVLKEQY